MKERGAALVPQLNLMSPCQPTLCCFWRTNKHWVRLLEEAAILFVVSREQQQRGCDSNPSRLHSRSHFLLVSIPCGKQSLWSLIAPVSLGWKIAEGMQLLCGRGCSSRAKQHFSDLTGHRALSLPRTFVIQLSIGQAQTRLTTLVAELQLRERLRLYERLVIAVVQPPRFGLLPAHQ